MKITKSPGAAAVTETKTIIVTPAKPDTYNLLDLTKKQMTGLRALLAIGMGTAYDDETYGGFDLQRLREVFYNAGFSCQDACKGVKGLGMMICSVTLDVIKEIK